MSEDANRQLRLQTDRLTLIACRSEFVDALENGPDEAARLLGADIPPGWPDAELAEFLPVYASQLRADPSTLGYGVWLLVADETRTLIGSAGFLGKPDGKGSVEIGFGVLPGFRNSGYATEAVNALLGWVRRQTDVRAVVAHCDPGNPASIRVLEKAGMKRAGTRDDLLAWSTEALRGTAPPCVDDPVPKV